MEKIVLNEKEYEVVINYKNGFDREELTNKFTDYFDNFDYVCGDWAYGKLRLKGFYNSKNKLVKEYNNYDKLDDYLKNNCANDAKYFVIKTVCISQLKVDKIFNNERV